MHYSHTCYNRNAIAIILLLLFLSFTQSEAQIIPNTNTQPGAGNQALNTIPPAYGSSVALNYVRVWEATRPFSSDTALNGSTRTLQEVKQNTQYFDGLGRPLQSVIKGASSKGYDMVTSILYDAFGREIFKYLPYTSASSTGDFRMDPFNEQNNFMKGTYNPTNDANGEKFFYGKTDFETSPLNRTTKTYAPGNNWVGDAMGVATQYDVNATTDSVRIWDIGFTSGNVPVSAGFYATGQLYKTTTTDEAGNKVVEYKNKEGQVILKKVQISGLAAGHSGWLCTYYIYDDMGNLRFVIQPRGTDWLKTNSWTFDNATWKNCSYCKRTMLQL